MSRCFTVRFLVALIFALTCLSGCQQQAYRKKTENSSYRFVDTTTKTAELVNSNGTELETAPKKVILTEVKSEEAERASRINKILQKKREIYVTVTAYCPCASCCGWTLNRYGTPVYNYGSQRGRQKKVGYTSTGAKADVGTIAADIRNIPYGSKMYVPGYGFGEVKDTGGLIKGNHIDLFFNSHRDAMKWGVKYLKVAVWDPETN